MLDVEPDHLVEGGTVLAAHLPQAGQTRHGIEPPPLPRPVTLVFVGNARSWPHQAHLPAKNVDDLGKLIQPGRAQQGAQWNQARIAARVQLRHGYFTFHQLMEVVAMGGSLGPLLHRPEFVTSKLAALETDAPLEEQDWPP